MWDCVATQTARHRDWPALWEHFGFFDTNELTLGEYFYDIDHHFKGLSRRGLRSCLRRLHGPEADPSSDRRSEITTEPEHGCRPEDRSYVQEVSVEVNRAFASLKRRGSHRGVFFAR